MRESNPDINDGFITDGSHIGSINHDMTLIEAVWITGGSGMRGRLMLGAERKE